MGDVIFSGNDTHAPLGMAEVSFMLECEAPPVGVNGESIASLIGGFSEVTVTRRYFRSGESEYFINKVPCRLKDIIELFLGSGAGTKAYAIIEQGRVDRLINARPEEIRLLIEEAAGVSLYRSRRQTAERKLERTRDNLLRVTDLMREMERQLAALRRQAKKTEQYQAYQRELREVDLLLSYHTFTYLQAEVEEGRARGEEVAHRETAVREKRLQMEADHRRCEEVLAQAGEEMRGCEARLHFLERELSQGEQRIEFLRERAIELAHRLNTLQDQKKDLNLRQEQVAAEITRVDQHQLELQQIAQQDEAALKGMEEELSRLQQTLSTLVEQEEEIKSVLVDLLTQEARVKNTLVHVDRRAKEAEDRLLALQQDGERIAHHLVEAEGKVVAVRSRLDFLCQQAETEEQVRQEKTAVLRLAGLEGEQCEERLLEARAKQMEVGSRLETLREMERKFAHYPRAVQTMMTQETCPEQSRRDGGQQNICGVVAQVFEVPQAYERAVAAVLGEKLECIIVTGVEQGVEAVKHLCASQGGRGSFVPLAPRRQNRSLLSTSDESGQGEELPLLKVVSVAEEYREVLEVLMGDAVVVSDLAAGLRLWQKHSGQRTFVTLQGEVLSPQGLVSGGSEAPATEEILERRREIRELAEEMVRREEEVALLSAWRQEIKKRQQALEEEIQGLEVAARERNRTIDTLQREQGRLEGEHRRLLDRQEGVDYERQAFLADQRAFIQEGEANKEELANLASIRQEQEGRLAYRQEEIARTRARMEEIRTIGDERRVRMAERRERGESLRHQVRRLKEEAGDLNHRLTSCQDEAQALQEERICLEKEQVEVERWLVEKGGERETVEQECARRRDTQEEVTTEAHRLADLMTELRQEEEQLRDERSQLEVALAERRVAVGHVRETVREKYGVEIETEIETERARMGALSLSDLSVSFDRAVAEQRRSELKEKISRLGEVNPTALSERAELEERYHFVQEQEKDLRSSLDDLQRTITRLNRECRERFRATFAQANEKLQEVYGRLVEGGKAHLMLQEEQQTLEGGVEVVVQPPGKRLHTLQLLSGGEKALAALSLVFALFLIRPSPFCFLDEVDAPLDDANVVRFSQLVREMSQEVQIVLITHNKRTMEAADTLYGVTMPEPGFSTIVSVRMG
jgi:chromosome segregation protein